eukprot:7185396-Lingulodinium_polyedra.AAC.1
MAQASWRAHLCWPQTSTRGSSSRPRTATFVTAACRGRCRSRLAWRRRPTLCPRCPTRSAARVGGGGWSWAPGGTPRPST